MRVLHLFILALPLAAQEASPPPAPVDLRAFFVQNCVKCHGADGAALDPDGKKLKGQDFTDPRWREGTKEKEMVGTILKGKFFGMAMPPFKQQLTEEQARQMVQDVLLKTEKGKPVATGN